MKNEFRSAKSVEDLHKIAEKFKKSIENDTVEQDGWIKAAYATSKMIINTYARVLGDNPLVRERDIQVYTLCPGWVRTDMTGPNATKSIEEGVLTPVYLVELEDGIKEDLQGKFFYEQKLASFDII